MPDSVDCLTANLNESDVESQLQTWLNNNSGVTSVDDIEVTRKTNKRVIITIAYTA